MAELTINVDEIAAAIRSHVGNFKPELDKAQVGRILEVGDGIARVSGLPDTAVNELLEFEGSTFGLALNLDEDSIGAVILGEADHDRRGPDRPQHRPHPLGPGRRRPHRPGRERARSADRRQGPDRRPPRSAASRSRRPASSTASRWASRCRPASRPSTR